MRPARRLLPAVVCAAGLLAAATGPATAASPRPRAPHRAEAGRVVVGFKAGTSTAVRQRAVAGAHGRRVGRVRALDIEVVQTSDVTATIAELAARRDVRWAQREVIAQRLGEVTSTPERTELRVAAARISAGAAFDGAGIKVGVIDDGVWRTKDLGGTGDSTRLVDGGDCSDDADCSTGSGINTTTFTAGAHGTAVATLIAARRGNSAGIVGAAPAATVHSYRVFAEVESGASDAAIAAAIVQAAADDMDVVNLSLGTPVDSVALREAIESARATDPLMVIVAAAGNDGSERASYPAGNPGVLAVGASECVPSSSGSATACEEADTRRVTKFSTAGDVDVLAPGVNVRAWYASGAGVPVDPALKPCSDPTAVTCISGTSFAAPQIAGVLAGLAGKGIRGDRARAAIAASSRRVTTLNGRPRAASGYGRADAYAAYQLAIGTAAYSAAFFERGAFVPRAVGRRRVEVLRVDPQPLAGVNGPASLIAQPDDGRVLKISSDVGTPGDTPAVHRVFYRYLAPRVHSGNDLTLLVGAAGETRTPLSVSLLQPTGGPEGKPIATSLPTTRTRLTYGSTSSVLYEIALTAGDQLRLTFKYPATSESSLVEVWLPESGTPGSLGASDAPFADDNTGEFSGSFDVTAPITGRYTFGVQLFDPVDDGDYDLAATIVP